MEAYAEDKRKAWLLSRSMRLMQDEQPVVYHVIKWRNSEFHNHDTARKRKLLGGVSFDGGAGAATGSGRHERNMTQAGVQEAQPSFPNAYSESVSLSETGLSLGKAAGGAGTENAKANETRNDGKARDINEETVKKKEIERQNEEASIAGGFWNNIIASAINMGSIIENTSANNPSTADNMNSEDANEQFRRGRLRIIKGIAYKLGKGIQTLLSKNEQDAGRRSGQKPKKKFSSGTRPITKEDVYEIQVNSSYLLESYNKNGERSTLGKQ